MKVKASFTVDVDEEAWSQEYGTQTAAEIRGDVKHHVESYAVMQLQSLGVLKES